MRAKETRNKKLEGTEYKKRMESEESKEHTRLVLAGRKKKGRERWAGKNN